MHAQLQGLGTYIDALLPHLGKALFTTTSKVQAAQGRSQDLVSGGGTHFGGGGDPLFFASDPKSQGSPLMYFWLPPDFGGGGGPGPPAPLATPLKLPHHLKANHEHCVDRNWDSDSRCTIPSEVSGEK